MAMAAVATKQALTLHKAQIAVVKKQHEMEMSLINMLTEAVESAHALMAPARWSTNGPEREAGMQCASSTPQRR